MKSPAILIIDGYVIACFGDPGLLAAREIARGPVIDGVGAAVKFVEALVALGLRTSKVGDLAYPIPKLYTGALASYAPKDVES